MPTVTVLLPAGQQYARSIESLPTTLNPTLPEGQVKTVPSPSENLVMAPLGSSLSSNEDPWDELPLVEFVSAVFPEFPVDVKSFAVRVPSVICFSSSCLWPIVWVPICP